MDYSIKIGGEAGQGIQTIGNALGRVFARSGYHVFSHQDYESRVRGGHNFYQIRLSNQPLGVPGDAAHLVVVDSDEHDEEGHIVEDGATRKRMVDKRFRKLPLITNEIAPPELYGDHEARIVVVGWGSTYGVMKEAVDALAQSEKIAMLHFSEIFPLPDRAHFDYPAFLHQAQLALCIEHNATGQFSRLLRAETGFEFKATIHKYDGRPFTVEELTGEIHGHIGDI
ncbi:MAG: 2-oxoacid:acceptor oxidoreductase family protein [Desulfoarculaceae bacterium]|nr:2-oxoacid:acceptor oxidoreductase family protein [Desulfoarculaceae bacterium]